MNRDKALVSQFLRSKGLKKSDISLVLSTREAFNLALRAAKASLEARLKKDELDRASAREKKAKEMLKDLGL